MVCEGPTGTRLVTLPPAGCGHSSGPTSSTAFGDTGLLHSSRPGGSDLRFSGDVLLNTPRLTLRMRGFS